MSITTNRSSRISPESVLLGYLYHETMHGYELHKRMASEFGNIWHASQSQTYNILNRLIDQGFINSTTFDQDKHPSKQILQISESGRIRFEEWLNSPTNCSVHAIRVEFITRLKFMQEYFPEKVGDMIKVQEGVITTGIKKLADQQEKDMTGSSINHLALKLRIKLLNSVLEWMNDLDYVYIALRNT